VNPDLETHDAKIELSTVRYEAVNAMLLNEFLKAPRQIDVQQNQIDALTAGLQKVSAQLEANKPEPRVVNNLNGSGSLAHAHESSIGRSLVYRWRRGCRRGTWAG